MAIEIPSKIDGWDDPDGEFNETEFYHFLNIGWIAEDPKEVK